MRRISGQTILLMIWPYLAMAADLLLIRIALTAWLGGLLGTLLVLALNVHCALRQQDIFAAARMSMLVKLVHIPAYVFSLLIVPMIWMAPPMALMLLATNVCMLLASSAYSLRAVYLSWRCGSQKTAGLLLIAVSQLIFVLDVPGSVIPYRLEKRRSH